MSPVTRIVRTVVQVVVACAAAVPVIVGAWGFDADTTAKIVATAGAVVVTVTAVQNIVEKVTGKTVGATDTPVVVAPAVPPVDVDVVDGA